MPAKNLASLGHQDYEYPRQVQKRQDQLNPHDLIRPVKIRHYVSTLRSWGYSAADILEGSHIDEAQLSNPTFLAKFSQCKTVISNIIRLTSDQSIGFKIGQNTGLSNLGVACQTLISCKTVRDSLQLWARYSNALFGTIISIELDDSQSDRWSLTFDEVIPMGFMYNFCVEEYLTIIQVVGTALSQKCVRFHTIELSYSAPTHQDEYQKYLKCTPKFNQPETRITFDRPHLDAPLPGYDEAFNKICQQHCSQILRQLSYETDLTSRLKILFLSMPGRIPTMEETAQELRMSPRTLRRRLHELSTNFQKVLDEYRLETAKEHLNTDNSSTKEISYLLGFRDADTFRRIFKQWTGQTVTEYRRRTPKDTTKTSPDPH